MIYIDEAGMCHQTIWFLQHENSGEVYVEAYSPSGSRNKNVWGPYRVTFPVPDTVLMAIKRARILAEIGEAETIEASKLHRSAGE